jgi:hypothetical protein
MKVQAKTIAELQNSIPMSKEEIARIIYKLNYIVPYPYPDNILLGMADVILTYNKNVKSEELNNIMDGFLFGKYDFNKDIGVVNFTKRLKNNSITHVKPEDNKW